MRIRVSDPELVTDLRDTLRRAGCIAAQVDDNSLQVAVPDAPTPEQEAREVHVYLTAWTAAHGVEAELVDEPD